MHRCLLQLEAPSTYSRRQASIRAWSVALLPIEHWKLDEDARRRRPFGDTVHPHSLAGVRLAKKLDENTDRARHA